MVIVCVCVHARACMSVCMHLCLCVCKHVWMCVCAHVCVGLGEWGSLCEKLKKHPRKDNYRCDKLPEHQSRQLQVWQTSWPSVLTAIGMTNVLTICLDSYRCDKLPEGQSQQLQVWQTSWPSLSFFLDMVWQALMPLSLVDVIILTGQKIHPAPWQLGDDRSWKQTDRQSRVLLQHGMVDQQPVLVVRAEFKLGLDADAGGCINDQVRLQGREGDRCGCRSLGRTRGTGDDDSSWRWNSEAEWI